MKIPAIRGKIGNTVYYTTNMTFQNIAKLVNRHNSEEIFKSGSLKDVLQRSLTDNVSKIRDYILMHEDRFFNAMVLAVYGGNPRWKGVRFEIEKEEYDDVGLLELDGEEKIFPIDGQHRLEGIKATLEKNEELFFETIPIILIGHQCTSEGIEKSRRIFSTLNRYAKPVRKGDIIALDEDDIVAICSREIVETHKLFSGNRIKVSNSKSIPVADKSSITTLMTLYDIVDKLFIYYYLKKYRIELKSAKLNDYKRSRPTDSEIQEFTKFVFDFWDSMINSFDALKDYVNDNSNEPAKPYRPENEGGHLFFRPVGLYPFVFAVCDILSHDMKKDYRTVISEYSSFLDCNVSSQTWSKILWDPITKKMIARNGTITQLLLRYMYSPELLSGKEISDMKSKYATLMGLDSLQQAEEKIKHVYKRVLHE